MPPADLRILIASTEKTGNTWLKLLLSHVYDLPTPHIGEDFSVSEADALGPRWVTHQHFLPERRLLDWASASGTHLLTTVRHPAAVLVSLYHYCCNYAYHYKDDRPIARALLADAAERDATSHIPDNIVDGQLIRTLQDRLVADLNISISWILSGRSVVVRYENLVLEPAVTLRTLCRQIRPASEERVAQAFERCRLEKLRQTFEVDSRFFRRGLLDEWRAALPKDVLRRFRDEEPFTSQLAFLGCPMEVEVGEHEQLNAIEATDSLREAEEYFDNGVAFAPLFWRLLASIDSSARRRWANPFQTNSADCFYTWLNQAAEQDSQKTSAIPRITNLAAFIHNIRPDLQAAYSDIFDENRMSFASWFLRYAGVAYQLDRCFLTPVALSWISARSHLT